MAADVRPFGELFAEPTRNGLTRPKAVRGSGIKMVNMGELFANPRLCNAPMDRVPLTEGEAERFLLADGDLLFARQSLVLEGAGKCSIFLHDTEPVTFESHVTRVRLHPDRGDPRFYFYYLQSHHGRAAIRSIVEQGAGASGIRGSDLQTLRVRWLPIAEQRAIAHILGTLDDKIELNRRTNETLEAMARALFKSWFIDFDPVRAKAEGRDTGLPPHIAELFPDAFEDLELGEIPKGWTPSTVADVCETVTRGVTPKYEEGSRRYIINQRVNRGARLDWASLKELSATLVVPPDCYAQCWDVLVNCLGEGTLGRTHLFQGLSGVYAVDQHMSMCRAKTAAGGTYLYQVLASQEGQERIASLKTGSTGMTMLNITKLRGFELLWPGAALVDLYFKVVEPVWHRVANSERQSETFAGLRDVLSPKLISGELSPNGLQARRGGTA